jgi:hypothetical protein
MEPQDPGDLGPCPDHPDLVLAVTSDLTADEWRVVQPHLEHCPKCRPIVQEIVDTESAFAQIVPVDSPERQRARHEWQNDLMAASRAAREAVSLLRWIAVVAAIVVLFAGSGSFRDWRAYADEILALAAQRERVFTTSSDVWLMTFSPSTDGYTGAASGGHGFGSSASRDNARLPASVMQLLREHGLGLTQPLSVARVQEWRASQRHKRDRVTRSDGWLVIQSTTRGPLTEVELLIDESSYQVLKQTWVIAGVGRVVYERITLGHHPVAPLREVPRRESRPESER